MAEEPSEALRTIAPKIKLREIGAYELYGARGELGGDGERTVMGPGRIEAFDLDQRRTVGVHWGLEGARMLVRLHWRLSGVVGEVRVGIQAEYELDGITRDDVPDALAREYVNRVATMSLFPYVREAVADLSLRTLGNPVTLGIMTPESARIIPDDVGLGADG